MTLLNPNQIDLRELFSVSHLLNSRGFIVQEIGQHDDLLIPIDYWKSIESKLLFDLFNNTKSRNEILDLINNKIPEASSDLVLKLLKIKGFVSDRNKYSNTFEWYIGELLIRKFSAFSYSYGVLIKNIERSSTGEKHGDFDVISVLRSTNLIYVECKSGSFRNITKKHVLKCYERGLSIHCEFSIMIIDDIIDENHLKIILKDLYNPFTADDCLFSIHIKDDSSSKIYECVNCYFVSSKENIENQIKTILRVNEAKKTFAKHISPHLDHGSYKALGYEMTHIH